LITESSESLQDEVASAKVLPHSSLRKKAMNLLARREYAVGELRQKLLTFVYTKLNKKDAAIGSVDRVIDELQGEGLLSDERFTEAFVRYRKNNGHGPMRIQTELRERGVSEKIQATWLDFTDPQWLERVAQVRSKRFGDDLPGDYKERARQARFLQYRGFTTDQIKQALAGENCE
jgi:regulatory protein